MVGAYAGVDRLLPRTWHGDIASAALLDMWNGPVCKIRAAAALVGGMALIVHAIDEDARDFWQRRGFLASKDDP